MPPLMAADSLEKLMQDRLEAVRRLCIIKDKLVATLLLQRKQPLLSAEFPPACVEDMTALSCQKKFESGKSPIFMSKAWRVVGVLARSWATMSFLWTSQDNILFQNMR